MSHSNWDRVPIHGLSAAAWVLVLALCAGGMTGCGGADDGGGGAPPPVLDVPIGTMPPPTGAMAQGIAMPADPAAQQPPAQPPGATDSQMPAQPPPPPAQPTPPDPAMMGSAGTGDDGSMGSAGSDGGGAGSGGSDAPAPTGDICARWKADRANLSEGVWSGDVASCNAGDMTPEARDNALRLVNLYRSMAGLDPVEMTAEGNRLAQACALLMRANGTITHSPPASFQCYTEEAADTAGSSSLSSGPAVESVDGYMIDPGNPTTLGHRRWILSNMLSGIGFGSADRFSCQYQPATWRATGGPAWAAWPSPGQVPLGAFGSRFYSLNSTGWSVQSDSINLASAQVSVSADGAELPVNVTQLASGYGSRYAIGFTPMGWTAAAGTTYSVRISGIATPIEYDVEVVSCP